MNDEIAKIVKLDTSPRFVIVALYAGAIAMLGITGWIAYATWKSRSGLGLLLFFVFASAAATLSSKASERSAVNSVLRRIHAASLQRQV